MTSFTLSPLWMLVMFIAINFLNYMDRGVIPGAPDEFQLFIKNTLDIDVTDEGTYLGMLSSLFIGFYALAALIFGHLVHIYSPLKLMGIGLSIWTVAIFMSGLARGMDSFYLLAVGRAISGAGEASFQCTAPPFIDDYAPADKKVLWMAIFYTAIPFGTAVGYMYGSFMAGEFGGEWAFWVEAALMVPLVMLCFLARISDQNCRVILDDVDPMRLMYDANEVACRKSQIEQDDARARGTSECPGGHKPSFTQELVIVGSSPIWLLSTLGYATYTGTLAGFATFGPTFLLGLEMFDSETEASFVFGGLISIVGLLGTPLGGWLVDRVAAKGGEAQDEDTKMVASLQQMFWCMLFGAIFVFAATFQANRYFFLGLLGCGLFLLFVTTAAITVALMGSVPYDQRAFAISLSTLGIHVLGDVPSPVVIGVIKGGLAPHCGTVEIEGKAVLDPGCTLDQAGLHSTMLVCALWLATAVGFWAIAYCLSLRARRHKRLALDVHAQQHNLTHRDSGSKTKRKIEPE